MATIKDVAVKAGVSPGTVTRYFRGESLKEETKQRVETAIKKLEYKVNPIARSLRSGKSNTVGILTSHIVEGFVPGIIEAFEKFYAERDYGVVICNSLGDPNIERERMQFLIDKQVEGVVLFSSSNEENIEIYKKAVEAGIYIVTVDAPLQSPACDSIMVNNMQAVYEAVERFIAYGHSRIGIIVGPENYATSAERLTGYRRALEDHGIYYDTRLVWQIDYTVQSGSNGVRFLMDLDEPPTGIIATNYHTTLGALMAVNQLGLRIPDDISFIGFEHEELNKIMNPGLCMVLQPLEELGRQAAAVLLGRIDGSNNGDPRVFRIKTTLLEGGSIKRI